MSLDLKNKLIKTSLIFIVYLFYVQIISMFFGDGLFVMFISDVLFLTGIVYVYRQNLKEDFYKLCEQKLWKQILFAFLFAIGLFVVYMLAGVVLTQIFPEMGVEDGNTTAIYSIYSIAAVYTIFKTLIFATIAEELIFKESIRDVISSDILYIIVSSFIYSFMNIMYDNLSLMTTWLYLIPYLIFGLLLNIIYVKKNSNICFVIFIKFFYNLIPLTILLIGLGG